MTTATEQPNSQQMVAALAAASERMAQTARQLGMPRDQLERFLRAGYVPQPKQMAFHAAARACDQTDGPTMVALGGARGPGKSHAAFAQIALDDCQRFPGLKCLFLRKVAKAAKESFEDLRRSVLRYTPHEYGRQGGVVTFTNDSRIVIGHFNNENDIDNYLGIEYDVIVNEEAGTLSLTKRTAVRGSLRTSKPSWRPRLYDTTNPGGVGHAWFKATYVLPWRQQREQGTRFIPATYRDNAYLNPEYRAYLDGLTGWLGRAWRDGDWDIAAGQYFTNFRSDVHVITPFAIPSSWRVWGGLDYGFSHYTTFYLLTESDDREVFVVAEHAERGWLPQRHAPAMDALLARHGISKARLDTVVAGADVFAQRGDSEGKTIADQYAVLGWRLDPAHMDRLSRAAEFLQRLGDLDSAPAIPPTLRIFDTCPRLIECLPALEHDPNRPEDVFKVDCDDNGDGGDDPYDGAGYGLMHATSRAFINPSIALGGHRPAATWKPRGIR